MAADDIKKLIAVNPPNLLDFESDNRNKYAEERIRKLLDPGQVVSVGQQ